MSEWIPVTEGKPARGQRVLVTAERQTATWNPEDRYMVLSAVYNGNCFHGASVFHEYVLAWMPQPKPYMPTSEE